MDARARYDEICDDLVAQNPEVELTQMMGMPAVKADGKLVAAGCARRTRWCSSSRDPAVHAAALALDGAHLFDPGGNGRPFKEWVVVPAAHASEWPAAGSRRRSPCAIRRHYLNVQCSGWARIAARAKTILPIACTW